jgi:hypothetical protein
MVVVSQLAYSPDLSPCDIFWFPRKNQGLKRRRFADVAEIRRESLAVFDIYFDDFRQYFQLRERLLVTGGLI